MVEDNECNRALVRNLLEHQRFAVIEAENEDGAVREVKQQRPDMIIMDIQLPLLDGELIPLEGSILNIADQYDAPRNFRVYKPAFDHATTCRIHLEGAGWTQPCHFDPQVLKAFKRIAPRFEEI